MLLKEPLSAATGSGGLTIEIAHANTAEVTTGPVSSSLGDCPTTSTEGDK